MGLGVSVSLIRPMLSYMVRKGQNLDTYYEYTSFDKHILQDGNERMQDEEFDRLLDAASVCMQDERFGLHLGQSIEVSSLGILGYVLLNCHTIGEALAAYRRYNVVLCSGIDVDWEVVGREATIHLSVSNPDRMASRHAVEGMASSIYHILLALSCRNMKLTKLQFTHGAPADKTEYANLFGVYPSFDREANLMCLDQEILEAPILLSNREMLSTFEAYAEEARNQLLHGRTFGDQVYKWIVARMPAAFPSVADAALHFNVSVRTLQANLKLENTKYSSLLNKARMALAIHYLKNPRFTVAEIAYLLQFSEPSAFQGAFKKWTGQSPGQYRGMIR
jgi:AraC-like DNA-binding protein